MPHHLEQDCVQRGCPVSVPVEIANCTPDEVVIERVEIQQPESEELVGGVALIYEFADPTLAPGEVRSHAFEWRYAGDFLVVVHHAGQELRAPFDVRNPVRERAIAECEACNGEFGPMGMRGTEGCNCRTEDAGQTCRSDADCEGRCIYTRSVRLSSPPEGAPACTRFVLEGACSERTAVFGCRSYLEEPTYRCHQEGRAPYACVD